MDEEDKPRVPSEKDQKAAALAEAQAARKSSPAKSKSKQSSPQAEAARKKAARVRAEKLGQPPEENPETEVDEQADGGSPAPRRRRRRPPNAGAGFSRPVLWGEGEKLDYPAPDLEVSASVREPGVLAKELRRVAKRLHRGFIADPDYPELAGRIELAIRAVDLWMERLKEQERRRRASRPKPRDLDEQTWPELNAHCGRLGITGIKREDSRDKLLALVKEKIADEALDPADFRVTG